MTYAVFGGIPFTFGGCTGAPGMVKNYNVVYCTLGVRGHVLKFYTELIQRIVFQRFFTNLVWDKVFVVLLLHMKGAVRQGPVAWVEHLLFP